MNRITIGCIALASLTCHCSGEGTQTRDVAANGMDGSGANSDGASSDSNQSGSSSDDESSSSSGSNGSTGSTGDNAEDSTATSANSSSSDEELGASTNPGVDPDGAEPSGGSGNADGDPEGMSEAGDGDGQSNVPDGSDSDADETQADGDEAPGDGAGNDEDSTGDGVDGSADSSIDTCPADECEGPAILAPNMLCADGSTGGPVCARGVSGSCTWTIRSCPVDTPIVDDPGTEIEADATACDTDADCVACDTSAAADEGSCVCPGCPLFPVNATTCKQRQQAFQACAPTVRCPQVLCAQPPNVGCVDNQCVVTGEASLE